MRAISYSTIVLERLPEGDLVKQVKESYSGAFVSAKDLGVY